MAGVSKILTSTSDGDLLDQGAQDHNHAKIYQGFFYHATF
jgi:hypothetical protein